MKKGILALVAALALTGSVYGAEARATVTTDDDPKFTDRFRYDRDSTEIFRANEFSIDLFGSYRSGQEKLTGISTRKLRSGTWGGGVGINYFFTRHFGIASDTHMNDFRGEFIDNVTASFVARVPLDDIRLAPYAFAGGGRWFDGRDAWLLHGGAGVEFRFNPNFGLFTDIRYTWVDGTTDYALARLGVRVGF